MCEAKLQLMRPETAQYLACCEDLLYSERQMMIALHHSNHALYKMNEYVRDHVMFELRTLRTIPTK